MAGKSVMPFGTGAAEAAPVSVFFWPATLVAAAAGSAGLPLDHPGVTVGLAGLMLLGGLPHGAFDIALASRAWRLGLRETAVTVAAYLLVAATMALAWLLAPTVALVLFLAISAAHFGEDWTMLEAGLLRAMAGLSVIGAAAIGQPQAVAELFGLLAPGHGETVARAAVAVAPVALLVTAVGLAVALQASYRAWALAQAAALASLFAMPPTVGFFLYFVLLHSPRHLSRLGESLAGWSARRFWLYGGAMTAATLVLAALFGPGFWQGNPAGFAAEAFRVLSVVAAPHLLLSVAMDRRLALRPRPPGAAAR